MKMLKKVILSTIAIAGAGTALWFLYKRSSAKEEEELDLEPQPHALEDEAQELVEQRNIAVQGETKPSVKRMIDFIERNNTGMANLCRNSSRKPNQLC
ncbi:unnamed protein product [Nezara viridula]|uniref:Uncharacterized protein n=1 Tax=Nezara viridula TaxID=85310 RepID=A0A9P0E9P6_NEZVI|nr:unnamed protein product [Nezara viridula]